MASSIESINDASGNNVSANETEEENAESDTKKTIVAETVSADNSQTVTTADKSYSRLCGYLNKFKSKGIIKTFRRRWFVFSENTCRLYYYRSPNDSLSLGEIDISRATFHFDPTNKEKPGLFSIHTPDKEFILEAKDRNTCLFWLQELQRWRRTFSLKRTQQIDTESIEQKNVITEFESGLLAKTPMLNDESNLEEKDFVLISHIDCPQDVIGDNSANEDMHKPLAAIAQEKFQNLRNQMKNSVSVTWTNKDISSPSLTTYVPDTHIAENATKMETNPNSLINNSQDVFPPPPSPNKQKSPKMSSIRRKIQGSFRIKRLSLDNEKIINNTKKILELESNCFKCKELEGALISLKDDLCAVEDELEASREVVKVLHQQLNDIIMEKDTLIRLLKSSSTQSEIDILTQKDQELAQLNHQLVIEQQECDRFRNNNNHLEKEIEKLKEKIALFEELLGEKDKIVVNLTNEIFDLETEKRQKSIENRTNSNDSSEESQGKQSRFIVEQDEMEDLQDALQAFELQNKFLNKEILELNQLRKYGEEREHKLIIKCSEWEAKCCQIQSKLLYLLKELDKPHSDSQTQETIRRLLDEATLDNSRPNSFYVSTWANNKDYDDLGFNWKWGKEEDLLASKAENLKKRSEDITNKMKDSEIVSWRVKWDNFMANVNTKDLPRSLELKMLIRSGIPQEYRGKVWKRCVDMRVGQFRSQCCPDYYENLLCATANLNRLDPAAKQIELDLLRTLPNNRHYENLDSSGVPRLRRVLLAYSRHNPAIGYCQGINRLAAIALLFMEEEDAFWCLVAILEYIMPADYYSKTLIASQVDQRVLKDLVSEKLPRLYNHLDQYNIDLSLFTFNWFLTIFVDNVPVEIYLRIWDVFLYESSKLF
ncbi:TBC1 domain family member 2B-like isoform X2 [Centruroides vittatus]|uniref:TBC1 domain family member 2B-like isoform X2 n=1 Tax=Centruroides vittatus TaxID=120091 RepID=UPI00350F196E